MIFNEFIEKLASTPAPKDSVNQYAHDNPRNAPRRHNLQRYLEQMYTLRPSVLLVAEAPGYKGMRLTGVPFSSRYHIETGVMDGKLYGIENGYQVPDDPDLPGYREQTATIVWETLGKLCVLPLSWNSYPFHPHRPGELLTNRKPRKPEIELGRPFLESLLLLFDIKQVIAVGNTAHDALDQIGITAPKVRHPAQGGKNDFVAGLQDLLG